MYICFKEIILPVIINGIVPFASVYFGYTLARYQQNKIDKKKLEIRVRTLCMKINPSDNDIIDLLAIATYYGFDDSKQFDNVKTLQKNVWNYIKDKL